MPRRNLVSFVAGVAAVLALAGGFWIAPTGATEEGAIGFQVWFADTTFTTGAYTPGATTSFFIRNNSSSPKSATISCSGTGIMNCTPSATNYVFDAWEQLDFEVTFDAGAATSTAEVTVSVTGGAFGGNTLNFVITPSRVRVNVPGPYTSPTQTVHRSRPVVRGDFMLAGGEATDTSNVRLWWRGNERTTQIRRNSRFVEWEVGAADSLVPGDSAQLKIQHCLTGGSSCTVEIVYVKLPNDQTPVVDFTGMPFEATDDGVGGGFGPGIAVSGVDVETGFTTPAYVSMGGGRSAALTYSTRTSYPRALVATNIKLPWPAGTPDQLKAVLFDGATRKDSLVVASPSCLTGSVKACRVVLQADYQSAMISGGVSRRWLTVQVSVTSSGTTKTTTDSVEVVLVDRRDSPYGSGWWPATASRIHMSGNDAVLIAPTGTATIYRGSSDSIYLAPPGSTTPLVNTASGWELRPRGTTAKVVYDGNGRFIKAVDASGNRDSVAYDGSGRVSALVDPVGKTITFHYGAVTGTLDSIVSLPGSSGKRTTRLSIDTATNQLRYDSLSSPAARPIVARYGYQTYGAIKGTAQLRARAGRYGSDSVTILYDSSSSGRPIQARLMAAIAGGTVPVLAYRAAQLQGWKAYRSLDSVYVEITDPLGRWMRSRVNRWGLVELAWDQVGTIGRTSFDDVGRVLWTEGKNGDSSRVYTDYDVYGRVVRTYIRRSVSDLLRLDSMVYDTMSRVRKRINNLGKADSIGYDAAGRPNYVRDPSGAVTLTWYRTDGLIDSVRLPTATGAERMVYDATWKNSTSRVDASGDVTSTDSLDPMGRTVRSQGKIRVGVTATSSKWEWRRTRSWLDVANRADSSITDRTDPCNDPCTSPGTFKLGTRVTYTSTLDSIGRVAVMQVNLDSTTFVYDRLARVTRRRFPGGSTDSTVYDLAGNATRAITRRGDTIQTWFDLRNRPDSTKIPGYGVTHTTYGGPQDQATRVWVTGLVDSIGGVNPNRSFVFDTRGRLVADTLWTGSIPRVTTYGYDGYERPDTSVNATGTWVTRYDTLMGRPERVTTPFGDTLLFSFDGQGRLVGRDHYRGGGSPWFHVLRQFSQTGELDTYSSTVYPTGGGAAYLGGVWAPDYADDGENLGVVLLPKYTKEDGSGAASEIQKDSLVYDGDERLIEWQGMRNDTLVAAEGYSYDANGNLSFGWTGTFQTGTNRLTYRDDGAGHGRVYSYDNAGNLSQRVDTVSANKRCTWTYGYDGLNRLVTVRAQYNAGAATVVARYAYDVSGNRIARRVYAQVLNCTLALPTFVRYAVQSGHVLFETDSAGSTITRRYLWGTGTDDLLAVQVGSSSDSTFYTVKDKLGSVRAWVRKDGVWRWGMRYRPYGADLDSSGTGVDAPYRWTAREYDPETGYYYLRARYYDPSIGRFTQEDPIGLAGGRNLYAYVDGQPLEATDPAGLQKEYVEPYTWCSPQSGRCLSWDGQMLGNEYWWAAGGGGGGGAGFVDFDGDGYDDLSGFADFAFAVQMTNNAYHAANPNAPANDNPGFQIYYQMIAAINNANWGAAVDVNALVHQFQKGAGMTPLFRNDSKTSDFLSVTWVAGRALQFQQEFLKNSERAFFKMALLHEAHHLACTMFSPGANAYRADPTAQRFGETQSGYVWRGYPLDRNDTRSTCVQ